MRNKYFAKMILFAFFFAFICSILFLSKKVGLADNGDFYRVINPLGIGFTPENNFNFFFIDKYLLSIQGNCLFTKIFNALLFIAKEPQVYVSTQYVFIKISLMLGLIYRTFTSQDTGIFNVRYLGMVYSFFYAIALTLLCSSHFKKSKVWNILLICAITIIFCDIGYLLYFDSFYGEAATLVSLMLMFGLISYMIKQEKISLLAVVFFYIFSILLAGAKVANIPISLFVCLFGLVLFFKRSDRAMKLTVATFSILLVGASFYLNSNYH
jgi:uncharacterized membrane protein (UPF0136 family)